MPFFSVIMPTYGVEKYIEKAMKSIIDQSFTDWELIIVNDCTKDRSAEIASKFAKIDDRIRIVNHKVNKGLSEARNTGIAEACGSYIWFMDPDDYVDSTLFLDVKSSLDINPAQVVVFGHHEEYFDENGDFSYEHIIMPEEKILTNEADLRREVIFLEKDTLYGYAWNKFYSLDYLNKTGNKYEVVTLIEDIVFNVAFFQNIDKLNILKIAPYHYAKRIDNSLTNKFVPNYFELHRRRIAMIYQQYQQWGMLNDEVKGILGSLFARYIISAVQRNCDPRSGMKHQQRKEFVESLFEDKLFLELIPYGKSEDSRALSTALSILKAKQSTTLLCFGRSVDICKRKLPMLFTKIRSQR